MNSRCKRFLGHKGEISLAWKPFTLTTQSCDTMYRSSELALLSMNNSYKHIKENDSKTSQIQVVFVWSVCLSAGLVMWPSVVWSTDSFGLKLVIFLGMFFLDSLFNCIFCLVTLTSMKSHGDCKLWVTIRRAAVSFYLQVWEISIADSWCRWWIEGKMLIQEKNLNYLRQVTSAQQASLMEWVEHNMILIYLRTFPSLELSNKFSSCK